MTFLRSIFLCLFIAGLGLAGSAFGQGVTYPDGSVSTFKPGFFGVGIPASATSSSIFGVAAKGGALIAGVGQINGGSDFELQQPALYTPGNGLQGLPRSGGNVNQGQAEGISGDGKIKVGSGAVYWDADNNVHVLPAGGADLRAENAAAITMDGSVAVGNVIKEDHGNGELVREAVLWFLGGTGLSRLGMPPGFDGSQAISISETGAAVCGFANRLDGSTTPPTPQVRPFLYRNGTMESLPTFNVNGTADGLASAVSETEEDGVLLIVGSIGPAGATRGVRWSTDPGRSASNAFPLDDSDSFSEALALRSQCRAVTNSVERGRIVGSRGNSVTGTTAFMWSRLGYVEGSIQGLLTNTYKVSDAAGWNLTKATSLSADGYTVGGIGLNPDKPQGKMEGWIAVMPPILYPPIVIKPPNQIARPDEVFQYQVMVKGQPGFSDFSARGLPPGFVIDSSGKISGLWSKDEPNKIGSYTVTVYAPDDQGTGTATFTISLPPPPGATNPGNSKSIQGHGFLQLNKPPGEQTFLASFSKGASADGQVAVGQDGFATDSRAYRWTPADGISGLPLLPGALRTFSTALAVSADGNTIVGQAARAPAADGTNRSVATVWRPLPVAQHALRGPPSHYAESETALQAIDLGLFPGGIISLAEGVSANGSVVVGYGDAKDPDPNFNSQEYQAFRWTQATGMVGLGWIDQTARLSQAFGVSADGSTIVGSDSVQAMRWTQAEGMVGLGKGQGALAARATGISADSSTIIGLNSYNAQNDANRAFRWTAAGGMTDLGVLPGDQYTEARAVSGDGSVVVGVSGIKFVSARPFIWDKANGIRDLQAVLVASNPNLANWTLTSADAISADGKTITGSGTNPNGDREGYTAVLEVRSAKLLNISTRMRVLTGDKVLIGGFIITGTEAKKVMIRGIGPSLANFGLPGVMADPTLELHQGNATIARNDNWKTRPDGSSQQTEIEGTGIPPSNDLESAIVITLNPGTYTAILVDKNGAPGLGIVEVYDLAQQSNSKLANISTRGFVDTGDNVMIGGFIAGGGSVGGYAGELVRAIGPSLASVGVAGALQDTMLELYDGNGVLVASNDNWKIRPDGSSQENDIRATTIPPTDDRESAIVATLAPGNYTAIVRGKNNSLGIAVVEAYNLQ
jgi:probable HAF family extracellular repeat protein